MSEEPKDAGLEVRMALAGPLTSFAIAGVLAALWFVSRSVSAPVPIIAVLGYNAVINVALGAFNLVPAFPLDGGRVLRGSLWGRSKNLLKATRNATRVSEALSLIMIAAGLLAEIAVPNRSVVNFQEERLALVGLPCELQGFWRMNTHWIAAPKLGRNLVFTIGLFCSKVFDYQKMMVDYVQGTRGIDLGTVTKVNIKKNRLLVYAVDRLAIDEPVEVLAHAAREECNICVDYSAELADIAVGAIGSAAGWSTVLTRTPRGEDILNGAVESGYLEMKKLDPAGKAIKFLETLCERKRLRDPSAYIRHSTAFARPEPKLMVLEAPTK